MMNYRDILSVNEDQEDQLWKLELIMEALNAAGPNGKWEVENGWLRYSALDKITPSGAEQLRTLANGTWLMLERLTGLTTQSRTKIEELAMEQRNLDGLSHTDLKENVYDLEYGAMRPLRHYSDRELNDLVLGQVVCDKCKKVLPSFREEQQEQGSELAEILALGIPDPGDCVCEQAHLS